MADPKYGCEVGPNGPQQDMWAFDDIAGIFPPRERDEAPNNFTGGMGGQGLGGVAETPPEGDTRYERIGF